MLTKLQLVQRVLSAMDSDQVASIDDTVEAGQVALIVDTVYSDILHRFPWPHLQSQGTLEVTSTAHKMRLPADVLQVNRIKYNKKDVAYITPESMMDLLDSRDTTNTNVDSNGAVTDADPTYWTSEDSDYIIFDSYDGTLAASLSKCLFIRLPSAMTNDSDVPDLPDRFEGALLFGILAEAYRTIKDSEQIASRYERKYISHIANLKRWASRVNLQQSFYGNTYQRQNVGLPVARELRD